MHEFNNNEIDIEDKKNLEQNIKDLKEKEIFDKNLYEHGIFINSYNKQNLLYILFNVGKINYKDLNFDIINYYDYLFNSKSLLKIFKEKEYIDTYNGIKVDGAFFLENNYVFSIEIELTENGVNNIEDILLIIYKYIDIIKAKGFNKEYFLNFIKYNHNLILNNFRNKIYEDIKKFRELVNIYRKRGETQIFNFGLLKESDYDIEKLKEYLNNIKYEKSFYIINTITDLKELNLKGNFTEKFFNIFNISYFYTEFSDELKNNISNNSLIFDNLEMREINPYYSEKFGKDIPCYKQNPNKCKELNEFDFENDESYKEILLDDDKYYLTYYQIDKSSEAFIVNSYLEFDINYNGFFVNDIIFDIEIDYIKNIISDLELNKLDMVSLVKNNYKLAFKIKSFSDNTEKIIKDLIKYLKEDPTEEIYKFLVNTIKYRLINEDASLNSLKYIIFSFQTFLNKGRLPDKTIRAINNINYIENIWSFNNFKNFHNYIINKIKSLTFKIAGNIDKNLVESIHKYLKENIKISPNNTTTRKLESTLTKIINYYQKSNLKIENDNIILVYYKFDENLQEYMDIFNKCFASAGNIILRFNYSNAYTPISIIEEGAFLIIEQGRYKNVGEMEDDINKVLFGMINGTIQCENYEEIIESYKMKANVKKEKISDNLFNEFVTRKTLEDFSYDELLKKVSHIFTEPFRITILIARNDLPDDEYKNLVENRKRNAKYIINEKINITHTEDIYYLNKENL